MIVAVNIERLYSNGMGPAAIYPAAVVATTNDDNFNFPNSLYAFIYRIIPSKPFDVSSFGTTSGDGGGGDVSCGTVVLVVVVVVEAGSIVRLD